MAEKLTAQQLQAVTDRGGKLLVSAAAGSGKTKVLVDRLLSYLTDPVQPADLDQFLIITYTKAAAAELRGKIAAKLTERIANEPENRHLQQQLQRLYLTKISTVHAFCTDILREYAYQLDIAADFRVADEDECLALQSRAMQQILDDAYAQIGNDPDFRAFIDTQGFGRDDRQIPEILLKVYHSAKCHLNPDQWLDRCIYEGHDTSVADASQTVWGKYLIDDLHGYLQLQIAALERCAKKALTAEYMEKPAALLAETVEQLRVLCRCNTWDEIRKNMQIDYGTLRFSSKTPDTELVAQIKAVRENCKKGIAKKLRWFSDDSVQVLGDIDATKASIRGLISLTRKFDKAYDKLKRSRRVLDFSDLEHKMLDLLLGKSRSGPTRVAAEIGQRFREVMVDEYQDSNAVQDAIFNALTLRNQNCFMVGDVKQSIYQFRLADPGIFLEKYNTFVPAQLAEPGQGRKVLLSSNFRSSDAVIHAVNDVFSTCMSPQVGGLVYGEQEELKEGIPHIPLNDREIELYGIDVREDTYTEEAAFVAERISDLLDGSHMVRQGEMLRPITPEDIVILLRSPGSVGGQFLYALEQRGIRCSTGGSGDLLQTEEIETLLSLLQVISNPLQDIPLIGVLSSRIFCFTADDLAAFRSNAVRDSIYDALRKSEMPKAKEFIATLAVLRREAQMNNLTQLLTRIFALTRLDSIYASMSDGDMRVENLQSFCQIAGNYESAAGGGLTQFLEHLALLKERGLAAAGEQNATEAVTIMSIHKSKGLEFPVVFLCGLSRAFNRESARAQVLCDKELGLGLSCVDTVNRVRYPTIAKRAIATKMISESISEEMRVLYVAMTRAKDRLIMTYAAPNVQGDLEDISLRMNLCDPLLVTANADCPGMWVLMTALKQRDKGWTIEIVEAPEAVSDAVGEMGINRTVSEAAVERVKQSLSFCYPYRPATMIPSKQTATQLKGREKDSEAAENTVDARKCRWGWRKPSFAQQTSDGREYGTAIHTVLQHIRYAACTDCDGVAQELKRLVDQRYISQELADMIDPKKIANFFATDIGSKLRTCENVLREFKFSVLDDAEHYYPGVSGEKILLQGVVDCALIETDGITLIDFKSDRVTAETVHCTAEGYRQQIMTYAKALERIYQMPVKAALLYFFSTNTFIEAM